MTSVSKDVYTNGSDDIVNEHNSEYQSTIKMKPADVKSSLYIDFVVENNNKDPKCKVGDYVRISNYFWKMLHSKLVRRSFYD